MKKIKQPKLFPGDTVWEITKDIEPREIVITSVEYFADRYRYNINGLKETMINWFEDDYIDIMDERESYPASAVWTTKENLLDSYIYWKRKKYQAEEKLKILNDFGEKSL